MTDIVQPKVRVRRLPRHRLGSTRSVLVGGTKAYLISSEDSDGQLGEVMLRLGKQGSTLAGLTDAVSILLSLGLQHGVPLETIVDRLSGLRFEPAGQTDDPEVPAATSIVDYLARRIALDYGTMPDDALNRSHGHGQRHLSAVK